MQAGSADFARQIERDARPLGAARSQVGHQAQIGSVAVAQAKAESAVKFKRPTKVFEEALSAGGLGLRLLATAAACPLEGGLPLLQDGQVVGAIGVSGMQSTQDGIAAAAGAAVMASTNRGIKIDHSRICRKETFRQSLWSFQMTNP